MRRCFLISALVSLTIFSAAALGQSGPLWEKVSSAEGRFEVSFPFKPEPNQNTFGLGVNKVTMTMLAAEAPEGAFLVSYMDFKNEVLDPQDALLKVEKGSMAAVDGKLISSSATTFMGYPAREYTVQVAPSSGLGMVTSVKAVLAGRRLYQVAVVTAESNVDGSLVTRFMSSFRIASTDEVAKK